MSLEKSLFNLINFCQWKVHCNYECRLWFAGEVHYKCGRHLKYIVIDGISEKVIVNVDSNGDINTNSKESVREENENSNTEESKIL